MSRVIKCLLLTSLIGGLFTQVQANEVWPESVIVVTSAKRPVSDATVLSNYVASIKILNLDSVSQIEARLSEGLPANEALATAEFQRRVQSIGKENIESELRDAYQAVAVMMAYQLDRYPVIIFDEQWVVYGLTELSIALKKYRQWYIDSGEVNSHE